MSAIDDAKAKLRHAVHVERQDERARVVELEAEVARLNRLCAEWSRQNLAIVALEVKERKRANAAERQLEAERERADNNGHSAKGWRSRWETDLPHALERAEAAERQLAAARAALSDCLRLIDDLMPGVRFIALPDYALLNAAPIAARAALAQTGEGGR